MLEQSARELEETVRREEELRLALQAKEVEREGIEERYSNLQEEAAAKTRKLKKVFQLHQTSKAELADLQADQQREMEGLLESVRALSRELRLHMLVVNAFIPSEYQQLIEQSCSWNEEIGEWQLQCVAYTGNNMRRLELAPRDDPSLDTDLSHVYLTYGGNQGRPRTGRLKSGRPKSSRPKSKR